MVSVRAEPVSPRTIGAFEWSRFARHTRALRDTAGNEWGVLGDERGSLQLEVTEGTLMEGPVRLHFDIAGFHALAPKVRTLARLEAWQRTGRFPKTLFPMERNGRKWLKALQAYDGQAAGASQREIAEVLEGTRTVREEWNGRSDFLRARVQRLLKYARHMVDGGYRKILQS